MISCIAGRVVLAWSYMFYLDLGMINANMRTEEISMSQMQSWSTMDFVS